MPSELPDEKTNAPMAPSERPRGRMKQRLIELLNNPWSIALVSGLFLMIAAPVVTGFVQLTFSTKSWQVFGASNATGAPGSLLRADAVYRMPVGERFRVADDMFVAVRWSAGTPVATLSGTEGQSRGQSLSRGESVSLAGMCQTVTLHPMKIPQRGDTEFLVMFSTVTHEDRACLPWWRRLFG